jgi:hypothetical protein
MSPCDEVAFVNVVLSIGTGVQVDLHIVHAVGDHDGNLVGCEARTDILAIVAVTLSTVGPVSTYPLRLRGEDFTYRLWPYTQVAASCAAYVAIVGFQTRLEMDAFWRW